MAPLLTMNQLCKVCDEPAAGYHFGAFTCEGCKSFFGRTYNNLPTLGECKNNGQCIIKKKTRTSCKSCRLKKCLMVGMSKSGSRYGRRSNWFKIHCLIQDQAEMVSRYGEARPLTNGMCDARDRMSKFHQDSRDGNASTSPVHSSSSGTEGSPVNPTVPFGGVNVYSPKPPSEGFSSFESPTPPYERKEDIAFHPFPISSAAPLYGNNLYFHPARVPPSGFFGRPFNGVVRPYNMDIAFPYHRYVVLNPLQAVVRPPTDGASFAADCHTDIPYQEVAMDLSIKKHPSASSDERTLDDDSSTATLGDKEDIEENGSSDSSGRETPLDLTKNSPRNDNNNNTKGLINAA